MAILCLGNQINRLTSQRRRSVQYAVVAVDYFTKWVEIEALVLIMPTKIKELVYKNILCRYRVLYNIISDNGT